MSKCRVLCAGTEEALLRARCARLQQAGFGAAMAIGRSAAIIAASETGFDVAILCDSFSADEGERLAHDLGVVSPDTIIIRVSTSAPPGCDGNSADRVLSLVKTAIERKRYAVT